MTPEAFRETVSAQLPDHPHSVDPAYIVWGVTTDAGPGVQTAVAVGRPRGEDLLVPVFVADTDPDSPKLYTGNVCYFNIQEYSDGGSMVIGSFAVKGALTGVFGEEWGSTLNEVDGYIAQENTNEGSGSVRVRQFPG
jgi:hypothetical protein